MNFKFIPVLAFTIFAGLNADAQELRYKIPAHAQFVVTINNKAIVENSSIELLNETLAKLGAFEKTANKENFPVKSLMESDFNLSKQAYIYRTNTDSLSYIGILIPLITNHKVKERMFSEYKVVPGFKGYERRISADGKTQVAWDQESLFIFTGSLNEDYFLQDEVVKRYGIDLGSHEYDLVDSAGVATASDTAWAADEAVEAAGEAMAAAEAVAVESEEVVHAADAAAEATEEDEEEYDPEAESLRLLNEARIAKNDSIQNILLLNWISTDFNTYLEPENNLGENKSIQLLDQKQLLRMWIPKIDALYQNSLPMDIMKIAAGIDMKSFKNGYEDAIFDLIQDQHQLKLSGSVGVDAELEAMCKPLFKNKVNKKFIKYIPGNLLAYTSLNVSTQGYLEQLPKLISRWYSPLAGEYADVVSIIATTLEIALDEKAIGKTVKGDHVFYLNNLRKVSKEYISYEYDEDYNSTEVTKTKEEYTPDFLYMFTSEDQRLFKKTIDFAVKKEKVSFENGLYRIADVKMTEPIFVLFKEDIIFVASDSTQLIAIQENRFKTNPDKKFRKDLYANPFNMVLHTSAIPKVVKQLEIPVTGAWEQTLEDLSAYGDLQMTSSKLKKGRFYGEMSVELPKKDKNALQYILKHILENLDKNSTN